MYTIRNRRLFQDFLAPIAISPVAGLSLIALILHFGYVTTFWLVCGFPVGVFVLWALFPTFSKLKRLISQLRWWHLAWFLLFLSDLIFRTRDIEAIKTNLVDFWALYRIVLVSIVAVILIVRLAIKRTYWVRSLFRGLIGLLTIYALVSVASTLWSVYPIWTLYKSAEYLNDIILISAILASIKTSPEFKTLFDWMWTLLGLLSISVWLGTVIWPDQAIDRTVGLIGVQIEGVIPTVGTNAVGELGALLGIVALTRMLFTTKDKWVYWAIFLLSMLTLFLSQSRSPLTGFFIALILVFFVMGHISIIALSIMLLLAFLPLTNLGDLFWQYFSRSQDAELFMSLSGRLNVWTHTWEVFQQRPLLGSGAYAVSRFIVAEAKPYGDLLLSGAENSFLEALAGVGILGVIPLITCIGATWYMLLRFLYLAGNLKDPLVVEAIGVLAVLSVRSFFTAGTFIWHPPLTFLLVLGYAEFLRRNYRNYVYSC